LNRDDQHRQHEGIVESLDCGYRNATDRMVIVRCCGADGFYLERVVFPFEMLAFTCPPRSRVEIWTHGLGGPELLESLQADDLVMVEPVEAMANAVPYGETPWLEAG
jgi:hypothetical protein